MDLSRIYSSPDRQLFSLTLVLSIDVTGFTFALLGTDLGILIQILLRYRDIQSRDRQY